ncbi:hypothetical protein ACQJBY_063345 [Aegilops geniculata]
MLQLEEQTQARKTAAPRLFHTTARPAPSPAASSPTPPAAQPPPGWRPSPNYKGKNPVYRPPKHGASASSSSSAPSPSGPAAPPPPPSMPSSSASSAWRPSPDPWTGLVQAWPMPWTAPSSYGAPPAYSGAWAPGMRPSARAPGLLGSGPPPHAYTAYAPLYQSAPAPTASSMYPYGAPPLATWDVGGPSVQPSSSPYPPAASTSTSAPPTWDQAAFIAALNSLTTQDTGSPQQGGDSSVQ